MTGKEQPQSTKEPIRILVTGFGPFFDNKKNPSKDLVLWLSKTFKDHSQIKLHSLILKTEFESAYQTLRSKIDELKPDLVIAFGLKANACGFELESTARNQTGNIEDEAGFNPCGIPINSKGPKTLRSTLPLEKIRSALKRKNIDVRISKSAGKYVCNDLFYRLMQDVHKNKIVPVAGFVHLPYCEKTIDGYKGKANIKPAQQKKIREGAKIIIEVSARSLG